MQLLTIALTHTSSIYMLKRKGCPPRSDLSFEYAIIVLFLPITVLHAARTLVELNVPHNFKASTYFRYSFLLYRHAHLTSYALLNLI